MKKLLVLTVIIAMLIPCGVSAAGESASFNSGYVFLYTGEACSVSVTTTAQNLLWKSSDTNVAGLFGDYHKSKTVFAVNPGMAEITLCDVEGNVLDKLTVQVDMKTQPQTKSASFTRGKSLEINTDVFGEHLITENRYTDPIKLVEENIHFGSARLAFKPGDDVTDYNAYARSFLSPAMRNNMTLVLILSNFKNDTEDELMEQLKAICTVLANYQENIYIELGNEIMNVITEEFTIADYVAKCKSMHGKIKEYSASIGKNIYTGISIGDISVQNNEWNKTISSDQTYYDAVAPHLYTNISTYEKYTQNTKMRRLFSSNENMYKTIEYVKKTFPGKDIWITEYGTLDSAMLSGATSSERARLQSSKTLGVALCNIDKSLRFMTDDIITFANYHAPNDSQLFGIVQGNNILPNFYPFKKVSELVWDAKYIAKLEPVSVPTFIFEGKNYTGKAVADSIAAYSFGDDNGLKYVLFLNRSENPCNVTFAGNIMKPVWKYSTEHVLGEDYLRKTGTFVDMPLDVPQPIEITDGVNSDTIPIDGYSMTVCTLEKETTNGISATSIYNGRLGVPTDATISIELNDFCALDTSNVAVKENGIEIPFEISGSNRKYDLSFKKKSGMEYSIFLQNEKQITFVCGCDTDFITLDSENTSYLLSDKARDFSFEVSMNEEFFTSNNMPLITIEDLTSADELTFNLMFIMNKGNFNINWYTKDSSTTNGGMGPSGWLREISFDILVITFRDYVLYAYGKSDNSYTYLGMLDIKTFRQGHISKSGFRADRVKIKLPSMLTVKAGTDAKVLAIPSKNPPGKVNVHITDTAADLAGTLVCAAYDNTDFPYQLNMLDKHKVSSTQRKKEFSLGIDNEENLIYKIFYFENSNNIKPITKSGIYNP